SGNGISFLYNKKGFQLYLVEPVGNEQSFPAYIDIDTDLGETYSSVMTGEFSNADITNHYSFDENQNTEMVVYNDLEIVCPQYDEYMYTYNPGGDKFYFCFDNGSVKAWLRAFYTNHIPFLFMSSSEPPLTPVSLRFEDNPAPANILYFSKSGDVVDVSEKTFYVSPGETVDLSGVDFFPYYQE
ncbi:MAG: hypothetical protein JW969_18555, partial [Spirochaetales bacterium]|nr:hypothetical protein [Spirochaetales bacterium]